MADTPRYREIANDLRKRLARGEFPVGTALPPIADLQNEYDVRGLNTIRGAQDVLRQEGLVEPQQGRGTFVIALPDYDDRDAMRDDVAELKEALDKAQAALTRVLRRLE